MDSDAYNGSETDGSVDMNLMMNNEIVFETSESDRERINVDSNERQAVIESPMVVDSDTSYVTAGTDSERTTDSSSSYNKNTSSGSTDMVVPIYVELDDPVDNLSPGEEIIAGSHHQLEVSDQHKYCRICSKKGNRKETLYRCSTCRIHVCSQYHLRLWHNQNGNPQLQSPPIASRTRSKCQRLRERRAPLRGFTSDENEELLDHPHHQGQASTSRYQPYQPGMASRRVLRPRGPISSSRAIVESDSDTFDNPGGTLRCRRILRRSIGLRSVRRPSMNSSTHPNSDISPQPGPSGYVPPDMFPSEDPQEGPSNPYKRRCPNVSSSSDSE